MTLQCVSVWFSKAWINIKKTISALFETVVLCLWGGIARNFELEGVILA